MNRKTLKQRWADKEFQKAVEPVLAEIFLKRTYKASLDLRAIAIGSESPIKLLNHAHFIGSILEDLDFSFSEFSCQFNDCAFRNVNLSSCKFDRCLLLKSRFSACSFDQSFMIVNMDDAILDSCSFQSTQIKSSGQLERYGGRRVTFTNCNFNQTNFRNIQLRASKFFNCSFEGAVFQSCDMRGARFEGNVPAANQFVQCELSSTS